MIKIENTGNHKLYPRVIAEGYPPLGNEKSGRNGMKLTVKYVDLENNRIDPGTLEQGTDFIAEVRIKNTGKSGVYEEVALTHIIPSGWEIHNVRMDPETGSKNSDFEYQDIRDDRVYTYFDIKQGEAKTFRVLLNSSYLGKFYLPMITVETMYDALINARVRGRWITVIKPGKAQRKDLSSEVLHNSPGETENEYEYITDDRV
jgi:uncharacterized protein YfaS (alpha-2-macroglobulin family)